MSAPATYPVSTIAKLLMLSERRVQQLTSENVIPKAERGRYELAPAVQGYIKYLKDRSIGGGPDGGGDTIGEQKARFLTARADMAVRESLERAGRVLNADEMTQVVTAIVVRVRQRLLAIPVKAAPLVAVETEIEPCRAIIEKLIHECLAELSSTDPRLLGVAWDGSVRPVDPRGAAAAVETDGKRVGGPEAKAQLRK